MVQPDSAVWAHIFNVSSCVHHVPWYGLKTSETRRVAMEPNQVACGYWAGTVNGTVFTVFLSVEVINGKSLWFIDGDPLFGAVDGRLVGRTRQLLRRLTGVPILPDVQVEEEFEGAYSDIGEPQSP